MDLPAYLITLRRRRFLVIALVLVGAGSALAFALTRPTTYATSLSLSINRVHRQQTPDYQFDGYYAIQASDLVAQTVVSWLSTPSMLLEVYEGAGLRPAVTSLDALKSRFRTRKFSAQNIVVEFGEGNRPDAEKVAQSVLATLKERTTALNRTAEGEALFEVVGSSPVIVATKPNPTLLGFLGAITGLIVALLLAAFEQALRLSPSDADRH